MWKKVRVSQLERSPSAKCIDQPRPVVIKIEREEERWSAARILPLTQAQL